MKKYFSSVISLLDLLIFSYFVGSDKDIFFIHHILPVQINKMCILICMFLKDLREKKSRPGTSTYGEKMKNILVKHLLIRGRVTRRN